MVSTDSSDPAYFSLLQPSRPTSCVYPDYDTCWYYYICVPILDNAAIASSLLNVKRRLSSVRAQTLKIISFDALKMCPRGFRGRLGHTKIS